MTFCIHVQVYKYVCTHFHSDVRGIQKVCEIKDSDRQRNKVSHSCVCQVFSCSVSCLGLCVMMRRYLILRVSVCMCVFVVVGI